MTRVSEFLRREETGDAAHDFLLTRLHEKFAEALESAPRRPYRRNLYVRAQAVEDQVYCQTQNWAIAISEY